VKIEPLSTGYRQHRDSSFRLSTMALPDSTPNLLSERQELRATLPLWRYYDEQYRTNVFCQSLSVRLKKEDPAWDATQTPYYRWMLENGPFLDELETRLQRHGWVRPKKQKSSKVSKRILIDVFDSCGVSQAEQKVSLALFDTFVTMC
jgi:hypothetical protein